MITPGIPLTFSQDDLKNIGGIVSEIVQDLEQQNSRMIKDISKYWDLYEAEPLFSRRDFPWEGASNIVVPVVRVHADATIARFMSMFRSKDRIWHGRSDNEEFVKAGFARDIPDWLNWAARNEFDFYTPLEGAVTEMVVLGTGVLHLAWETVERVMLVPGRRGEATPQRVILKSGPVLHHIPRERILWDSNYRAWNAPVVARQSLMSWSDLIHHVNKAQWDWEVVEKLKSQTVDGSSSPTIETWMKKKAREGVDTTQGDSAYPLYDIREVHLDWGIAKQMKVDNPKELAKGEEMTSIVVVMNPDTQTVLAAYSRPYITADNTFYDMHFRKRAGQASSQGLARILRDIQEGRTTLVNQSIDVVTRANSIVGLTSDPHVANAKFALNRWTLTDDVGESREINLPKAITPDVQLMLSLDALAERLTGISDPSLGREIRMGGHPSPATSTLTMLQEARKLDVTSIRSLRDALSRMGIDLATLYQQKEVDEGKISRALGEADSRNVRSWMFPQGGPIPGNLELGLSALDELNNPDTEQQKGVLVFQLTANYYGLVMQYLAIAGNAQTPPEAKVAASMALNAFGKSYEQILASANVDDLEAFVFDLERISQGLKQQAAASGAGGAGGNPQPPPGNGVGPSANGNAGPPGVLAGGFGSGLG